MSMYRLYPTELGMELLSEGESLELGGNKYVCRHFHAGFKLFVVIKIVLNYIRLMLNLNITISEKHHSPEVTPGVKRTRQCMLSPQFVAQTDMAAYFL